MNGSETPRVLVLKELPPDATTRLKAGYECIPTTLEHAPAPDTVKDVRAVVTSGTIGLPAHWLELLPNLELIASFGVGTDGLSLDAYQEHGVLVSNTPGVLVDDVADLAMGLILATLRQIPAMDEYVRNEHWERYGAAPLTTSLTGKTLGVIGMGMIGRAVARRAAAFRMTVSHSGPDVIEGYPHYPDLIALAQASDVLLVSCPGGTATHGLVNAQVLRALGREGWLINISRGSIVDEPALLQALQQRQIHGAGLDVFATEPACNPIYAQLNNVVLSPHHASGTVETRSRMAMLLIDNLDAHFADRPLITPVLL